MTVALDLLLIVFVILCIGGLMPVIGDTWRWVIWQWRRTKHEQLLDEWSEDVR